MDKHTVFGSDGTADVAASANAYAKALTAWKKANEVPTETIEAAVEAVFDRFDGQRLQMPSLMHEVLSELGATPVQHKSLSARITGYVQGQCGLEAARNTGRLDITRGKGGGVLRLARPGEAIPARQSKSA